MCTKNVSVTPTIALILTTFYGLRFFSYHATKQWNSLPDNVRTLPFVTLKKELASLNVM